MVEYPGTPGLSRYKPFWFQPGDLYRFSDPTRLTGHQVLYELRRASSTTSSSQALSLHISLPLARSLARSLQTNDYSQTLFKVSEWSRIKTNNKKQFVGAKMTEEEHQQSPTALSKEGDAVEDTTIESSRKSETTRKNKRKKLLLKETAKADKLGVCYLSRIPPRMDPSNLRHILSQYGEILRIYLKPEGPEAQVHRKKAGGYRSQGFTEGWVEFAKKNVAKRVAGMLNGEQIGGKKRSTFYYDIWNIKYLSKFKWDNLTDEIAYKNAIREQKLALEISAARRERDFYLSKVDKSRALTSIQERVTKKQKVQQGSDPNSNPPAGQQELKVIRQFPQTRPFADTSDQSKPKVSKDFLAGVFGASS